MLQNNKFKIMKKNLIIKLKNYKKIFKEMIKNSSFKDQQLRMV